ncbi:MAG: helix-turn-helix domain-containing protein [Deltaproteobacteria bacterium]|jgi:predicted transcriptional regulator|nr:helix-turn-helix domain-containing protein [Deltaproteobacteria bacterium]
MIQINFKAIVKERESKLLSRTDLAKMADVSYPTLLKLENGEAVTYACLRKIIEALGFSITDNPFIKWRELDGKSKKV